MSDKSKVHGPYYLEYKDWSGGYRPIKDSKTVGYATKYKTIAEARKKAVSFMKRNPCQLVGIQGRIGKAVIGKDGRPEVRGGTAGIVERDSGNFDLFVYHDYNTGKKYRIGKDGSVRRN